MKNHFLKMAVCLCLLSNGSTAYADGGEGFGQVFQMLFGARDAKAKLKNCEDGGNSAGLLGVVNSFFCHMEKDMGITGPTTGVTKVITEDGQSMSVHAQVTAAAVTVGSVAYTHSAKVWVCTSACTLASNFGRAIYIAFNYDKSAGVNKGHLLMEPDRFQGASSSALKLIYDVGDATSNKTITAHGKFTEGADTFRMYAVGSKLSGVMSVAMLMHHSANGGMRLAARVDESANTGGVYFEVPAASGFSGTGVATVNNGASSDDKSASAMCFTRTASATDYTYAPAGGSCTLPTLPAKTITDLSDDAQSDVVDFTGLMDANPSSI